MKIEDLKYITPIDINAAHLNVTSAEMYEEAHDRAPILELPGWNETIEH